MKTAFSLKILPAALIVAFCGLTSWQAAAQEGDAPVQAPVQESGAPVNRLQQSVIKGLDKSPVLDAEVHALEAQLEEANVTFGGMLPTVDLRGSVGREHAEFSGGNSSTYNTSSYGIEARQNLFNGFASQARYSSAYANSMQSYYRYLNKANQVAFEASSAHIDVSRNQALIKLAESNLKYHEDLTSRIEEKVRSGAARQSDLEQARSRYTLALGNLATEKANAFSAMANYQRVTDSVWPINEPGEYVVNANFEVDNIDRLVFALNNHPLLKAANAQIEASSQDVTAASEGFSPRFDLRAKHDNYTNYLSSFSDRGDRQVSSIDLLASMNLYRGGADSSARNAAIKRKLRTMDDKLSVCRTIRQTSQSSLYDVMNLQKRLNYFRAQSDAISSARTAYQQQFEVGRRSLLDLLSAENEYYQAQRTLINIEADLSVSKLRLLSNTGQLISLFGVDNLIKMSEPARRNVLFYQQQAAAASDGEGCPTELISIKEFQLPNIGFDESLKSVKANDQPNTAVLIPPFKPLEVAQVGGASPLNTPNAAQVDPATVSANLIDRTNAWAKAWQSKDVNAYIAFYSPMFKPEQGSYEAWEASRRERLRSASRIEVQISDIQVVPSFDDPNVYDLTFVQRYRSNNYQEQSKKTLTWKSQAGKWQIIRERNVPVQSATSDKPSDKKLNVAMSSSSR
jgi:adhesin transport system outer membrane protein